MALNDGCYVYIFAEQTNDSQFPDVSPYVKIGVARDPGARRRHLQTGNPLPLLEVHSEWFATKSEARRAEAIVHKHFGERRVSGEWFEADIQEAALAVTCAERGREPFSVIVGGKRG